MDVLSAVIKVHVAGPWRPASGFMRTNVSIRVMTVKHTSKKSVLGL